MSITAKEAHIASHTALNAIATEADKVFIAGVDAQIQTAITLGQFEITAIAGAQVSLMTVFNYYASLGYHCTFPDYLQQNGWPLPALVEPNSNFFGFNWRQYWINAVDQRHTKNPARMTIKWAVSPPWPSEPV